MKRVLLDTNIYGFIAEDKDREGIVKSATKMTDLIIYGSDVIRVELRKVPKDIKVDGSSLRIDLLSLFDTLVKEHVYETTEETEKLANKYYTAYKEIGGEKAKDKIMNDFLIIACATLHELDIVCSEDKSSMLTELAKKAYIIVNNATEKRIPDFIDYKKFKKELGGFPDEI